MSSKVAPSRMFNDMFSPEYPKMYYAGDRYYDQSYTRLTPDSIELVANAPGGYDTALVLSKFYGTMILGPVALLTALQNIRVGPKSCLNPMLETYVPSTVYTPIPTLWPMKELKFDCLPILKAASGHVTQSSSGGSMGAFNGGSGSSGSSAMSSSSGMPSSMTSADTPTAAGAEPPASDGTFAYPLEKCVRTSGTFGEMSNLRRNSDGSLRPHLGVDLAGPAGLNVIATAAGTVSKVQSGGGAGNYVVVVHEGGYSSQYMHLSAFKCAMGQKLAQGGLVGLLGSTGHSTGPHLHFGIIQNGKNIDPFSKTEHC